MNWSLSLKVNLSTFTLDIALHTDARRLAVIGPNGAGKTTLLKTIAGAYAPAEGVIKVNGHTLYAHELKLDVPIKDRLVGYVPQGYALFPHLSTLDNLLFGRGSEDLTDDQQRQRAMTLLTELDCASIAQQRPDALSMGQRQRVALARALMINPSCLLLDEPLSALDPSARKQVRHLLANYLSTQNMPSLIVTHDQRDVFALSDYVCVIDNGVVLQEGAPHDVALNPINDFVSEFFERPPTA